MYMIIGQGVKECVYRSYQGPIYQLKPLLYLSKELFSNAWFLRLNLLQKKRLGRTAFALLKTNSL